MHKLRLLDIANTGLLQGQVQLAKKVYEGLLKSNGNWADAEIGLLMALAELGEKEALDRMVSERIDSMDGPEKEFCMAIKDASEGRMRFIESDPEEGTLMGRVVHEWIRGLMLRQIDAQENRRI